MTRKIIPWKSMGFVCVFWWLGMAWMITTGHLMPRNSLWLGSVVVSLVVFDGWLWQVRKRKPSKGLVTVLILFITVGASCLAIVGLEKESVITMDDKKILVREDVNGVMRYYVYKNPLFSGALVPTTSLQQASALRKAAPLYPLEITGETTKEGLKVFNVTLDEWIKSYNGYYWEMYDKRYLREADGWRMERQPAGMHFSEETNRAFFRLDESKWTLPTMSAYLTAEEGKLRELVCNYDDHSYSPQTFALYEEMCALTLRVFMPQLSAEDAQKWATYINKVGDENTFNSDRWYNGAETKPTDLFVHDRVGVFSYVAIGAPLNFCVIPVDDALIEAYQAAGVRIHTFA